MKQDDWKTKDFTNHHATPIDTIRAKCRECMGYQFDEIKICTAPKCPLYPYRMGCRPKNSKRVTLTEAVEISKR